MLNLNPKSSKRDMTEKTTVGEEAVKRLSNPDTKQNIVDTQQEMDKEYFKGIEDCIEAHKEWDEPYYIVVHMKKERLMENVIRRYFIGRKSLPTPQWDQTVWRYNPGSGDIRFLWVLPDENTAKWIAGNPQDIFEEHADLLRFITLFLDKQLYRLYYDMFHKEGCELSVQGADDLVKTRAGF